MTKSDSSHLVPVLLLTLIGLLSCWYTYEHKVELLGDNANYFMLGKALSQGEGYTSISHPQKRPNNHYPPGYPVLISSILTFTGDSIQAIKVLNVLLFTGAIVLFYLLITRWVNRAAGLVICLFCFSNSHLLFYSSIMMSEIPYLFFSVLALYLFTRADIQRGVKDPYLYLSLFALVATYYIRSLGVALLVGILIHQGVQRQWKQALVVLGGFVILTIPWFLRSSSLGGSSYMNQLKMINPYQPSMGEASLSDFVSRIGENLVRYITKELPNAIYPTFSPEYGTDASGGAYLLGLLLIGLGLWGVWLIKEYRFLLLFYLLATFGILMLWPQVWYGVRFIVPIIPFFYLALASSLGFIAYSALNLKKQKWHPYLALILVLPLFSSIKDLHDDADTPYHPAWENYFQMAQFVERTTDKDAVISTGKPTLFYLYADRPTIRYDFEQDPTELLRKLRKREVDYVVIDQVYGNTMRYLLPAVQNNRSEFEMVHHIKNPDTFLLRLKK